MNRHRPRTSILGTIGAIAAVGALVAAALLMLPAQATQPTPAPEVSTIILAKSLFQPIQVTARTPAPDRWKAQLKTRGHSDVYVVDNKFPPGASTGWHSHPGPSLILVVTGTVINYPGDDPSCTPRAYSAGDGFIDPGGGHVHMLRNKSPDAAAETIAVQLLPKDAARRIPADAPSGCPS
jgi:quercetin dioxygenase-like cupin family protein